MDDTGGDDLDDILVEGDEDQEGEVEDQNEEVLDQEERWIDSDAPLSGGDDDVVESEDEIQSRINEVVTDAEILEEVRVPDPNLHCLLCGHHELEEEKLGVLYRLGNLVVHHFCLMLSSGLQQVQL